MNRYEGQFESNDFPESIAPLEVEQKYRVESHEAVLKCLQAMKAIELPVETQCDIYLRHPCRDFATTGEAFRIRQVNDSAVVTYKGARLPGIVKTRVETEVALADKTDGEWLQILLALGFCEAARVRKRRRSFRISFRTETFTVALDTVESLGSFIEIEAIVTDRSSLSRIQKDILELAKQLQVDQVEPRSYLRQLLEQLQRNS
jgi:adenylate cyclase class 2